MVTQRTKDIILILLNNVNVFLSVKEIADQLDVTERTIYRQMKEVNELADYYNIQIINEIGRGIRITANKENIKQLENLFAGNNLTFDLSTQDRVDVILLYLLHEKDYIKAHFFAEVLNVSIQTIRNDFNQIKKKILSSGLSLSTKQASGYLIEGTEFKKRIILANIIREKTQLPELLQWIKFEKQNSVYTRLLSDLGYHDTFKKVYMLINKLFKQYSYPVTDAMFQDYIVLISLMINRLNQLSQDIPLQESSAERKENTIKIYLNLKDKLEAEFEIELIEDEKYFLEWVVSINNNSFDIQNIGEEMPEVDLVNKVHDFIVFVETTMGCRLRDDAHLQTALFEHLDRSLARTRSGITIKNPMLLEIKKNYRKLYNTIEVGTDYVFPEDKFPEDEIGFLVLHFAVALDKVLNKSVTALVVCSSGMGSSKMLANRLVREIPEIEIKKIVSFLKLSEESLEDYDIVFSTVSLPIDAQDYVMVSPLLNKKEVSDVKSILENIRFGKLHRKELLAPKKPVDLQNFPYQLEEISLVAKYGSKLLKNFQVVNVNPPQEEEECLKVLDEFLVSKKLSTNDALLTQYAKNKQLDSYFGIPNTKLGYIHCKSNEVSLPLFMIFNLEKDIIFSSMEKELMTVNTIVLVLSPNENEVVIAELLSMLTMLIIESPESIEMFERSDEKEIYTLISERIKNYLVEKVL